MAKIGKLAVESVSNGNFSYKFLFRPSCEVLLAKKSYRSLNVRKIRKFDEERVFISRKKNFSSISKAHKNGKAQNMPVVAGRLVCRS